MRYLLPLFFITILFASCGNNDEEEEEQQTYVDTLVGNYNGVLKTLSCTLPQDETSSVNSTAEITKQSETAIDLTINDTNGEVFSFSATVNADSTITIPEFANEQVTLKGSASKNPKLRVVLGDGCVLFGTEAVTYSFDEN